jgi:hypothetical protein
MVRTNTQDLQVRPVRRDKLKTSWRFGIHSDRSNIHLNRIDRTSNYEVLTKKLKLIV